MAKRLTFADLDEPYLRLLLYGQPGSTKTRTATTAAWDERTSPTLMLEMGGNPLSIRDYKAIPDIIHLDTLAELNAPYEWLRTGQKPEHPFCKSFDLRPPYKCIIVDSLTEVQRRSFNQVVGNVNQTPGTIPEPAQLQHFNKVLGHMVMFANLFYSLPMHVILTSLEREDKDEATGIIMYKPLLWGQSSTEVAGYAYMVARMVHRARVDHRTEGEITAAAKLGIVEDAITNETISVALFRPSGKYVAKDQYGTGQPFMVNPTIGKILDAIQKVREPKAPVT